MKVLVAGQEFFFFFRIYWLHIQDWAWTISIPFALDACCAGFFLLHVGIQKCDGNSVLIEISQGAENVRQTLLNSAKLVYQMCIKEMEDVTLITVHGNLWIIQILFQHLGSHEFGSKAGLGQMLLNTRDGLSL